MLDVRKVKIEEFYEELDEYSIQKDYCANSSYSYFLFGEKSGVIRDDTLGTVEFINLPKEALSNNDEMELLINICGRPGEFTEKVKVPSLKTITDYEEEARYVDKIALLFWIAQIAFILIPIILTIWLIAFISK
jgi:hypothetical protein